MFSSKIAQMIRYLSIVGLLAILAVSSFGQGLGSSNKLFGGAKKSSGSSNSARKSATKPRAAFSRKKKPSSRKSTGKTSVTKGATDQVSEVSNPKNTAKTKTQPSRTEITPVAPKLPIPTGPAADALYEDLIETGNTARDARKYAEAEDAYMRAASVKPKDSRAEYGLGNVYSDQRRWEDAEAAYRKALAIEPNFSTTHVALSYILTQPVSAPNLSARYEEAEKLARRAIQLAASNALAFDQLGAALELRGLIGAETEDAYRRAIKLNSTFAPPYAHLARLLRRRGLTKESEALYKTAIDHSNDVATMVLVADVMQSEQRFAESEKLLRKAVGEDPRNPSALILFGRALTALGQFGDAERVLKTSLTIGTNGYVANSLLGSLYLRQGKPELAENALQQALRFVSALEKRQLSQQFEAVGDAYMKTSKRINAERVYRQAIELDGERESLAGKLSKARFG